MQREIGKRREKKGWGEDCEGFCEMRNSSLDLISLSYENHEMIDVDGHLMERKIFKMIILGVDWWGGKTVGRRRRKSKPLMCYSMNVLFKWVVPTDHRKSVSACEQGKKVRKGFRRWQRVCCLSRDRGTTWTPSRRHTFFSPDPMPPHFTGHRNLETSPNLPSNLHVWMWELDCEESWVPKNWCFWTMVLEKTLESPLDCKEIQPVHSEGDQPWDFFGRNDAKAETPVLWPPHAKSWLIRKDSDAGRNWGQEEKGTTEDEMAGWHYWLDGRESEWWSWWWTGMPGMLRLLGSQRVGHDWATELNWTEPSKGLAKKWRNKTQDESLHNLCKMGISELRCLAQLMEN